MISASISQESLGVNLPSAVNVDRLTGLLSIRHFFPEATVIVIADNLPADPLQCRTSAINCTTHSLETIQTKRSLF
jgi:hypothetical protein